MTRDRRTLCRFAPLFGPRFGLFDHRVAHSWVYLRSHGSTGRFSAGLGWLSRGAQSRKKWSHGSTNLLRGHWTRRRLPVQALGWEQGTGEDQQIMDNGHNLRPTLKLLRGAQARLVPQQGLFLKAIAMFHAIAARVERPDLRQWGRLSVHPHKPADPRIAFLVGGSMPRHADHGPLDLTRLPQVQVLPTVHLDALPMRIEAFPMPTRSTMRARVVASKALSIFAWGPRLSRARWGRSIEDASTLGAQEFSTRQIGGRAQKRRIGIVAIPGQQRTQPRGQLGQTLAQLGGPHLSGRVLGVNALVVQDVAPATARIGQDHQRRKLPTHRHRRRAALGQVRHI